MINTLCKSCNNGFSAKESQINRGMARFCSRECFGTHHSTQMSGINNPSWNGGLHVICQYCAKQFIVNKSYAPHAKYCSKSCASKSKTGEKNPNWKGGNPKNDCVVCSLKFNVSRSDFERGFGKYCSRSCMAMAYTKNEVNPVTRLKKRIQTSLLYRQWRSDVFSRDGFECIFCSSTDSLQADHFPMSIAELMRKHELTDIEQAKSCEELWNINNGRTLCVSCHRKTENFAGRNICKRRKT